MSIIYLLNGIVEFDSDKGTLHSLQTGQITYLNKPASRCFNLLLTRKDEIIPKSIFLTEIWRKAGVCVSENTFYQNISLLRKALANNGLGDDAINTISRKGLKISSEIAIKVLRNERDPQQDTQGEGDITPDMVDSIISTAIIAQPEPETPAHPVLLSRWKMIALPILFLLAMLLFLSEKLILSDQYFASYHEIKETQAELCHLFYSGNLPVVEYSKIVKENNISCSYQPYVYISKYRFSTLTSIIQCRSIIDTANNYCISNFFVKDML